METRFHYTWAGLLRNFVLAATVATLAIGAVGCHTVRGMGRDVRSVGQGVEDASGVNGSRP